MPLSARNENTSSNQSVEQAHLFGQQVARWNDPATHQGAQERVERASLALAASARRAELQARQARKPANGKARVHWLRQAAKTFAEAVEPLSGCRNGCSACCYQSVHLTEAEARVMAKELGLRLAEPKYSGEPDGRYQGEPCVFLLDGRCGIYESRPMACRLLFNMDTDDLLCHIIPGSPMNVPYANTSTLHLLYLEAHLGKIHAVNAQAVEQQLSIATDRLKMADVREFFPSGLSPTFSPAP